MQTARRLRGAMCTEHEEIRERIAKLPVGMRIFLLLEAIIEGQHGIVPLMILSKVLAKMAVRLPQSSRVVVAGLMRDVADAVEHERELTRV